MMTDQERLARLEAVVEELSNQVQAQRSDFRSDMNGLRAEMNSRFNNHLIINIGLWVTTMGSIIGLYFSVT